MTSKAIITIFIFMFTSLSYMSLTIHVPALNQIALDFGISYAYASITFSGYLVITAVLQIVIGYMSDSIGRRSIILFSLLFYTLASLATWPALRIAFNGSSHYSMRAQNRNCRRVFPDEVQNSLMLWPKP